MVSRTRTDAPISGGRGSGDALGPADNHAELSE
jgi:hypothetical protein